MAVDVATEAVQGKVWVHRQWRVSGQTVNEEANEERILVDAFEVEPAYVRAGLAHTVNLGNYESLKVEVGVSLPCYKEEIPQAMQEAFKIADTYLWQNVEKYKNI